MDIRHIQEFLVLADTGNFMETAEKLFVSQSSLTRHIKTMEEELGAQLFDRTTRKVTLSRFGHLFLQYAREINRIQYEYNTAFFNELQGVHGVVRVGSIPSMVPYKITDVLARFQRENSAFSLEIIEEDPLLLIKMLRSGQCDFAFIREANDADNEFNKLPYASDVLVAIAPESHTLAAREVIQFSDLLHEPLLLLSKDSFMYNLCITECRKAGFEPRIVFTGQRGENILDFVEKGLGIALLTKKASSSIIGPRVTVVNIEPIIRTTISLAYPKHTPISDAANHFFEFIQTVSEY